MTKMLIVSSMLFFLALSSGFGQAPGAGSFADKTNIESFMAVTNVFSGADETYFYSTTTYTFTDLVVFSYFDESSFYVYNQAGAKIDSVTLNENQYHVFSTGTGVYRVECTQSFTVLVGDPVSRSVLGYFAVDESGSPISARLNTYMPDYYTSGEHFIIFAYHSATDFVIKDLQTSTVIAAGVLNEGEHFQLDGYSNTFIGVEASKPVSALSYTDQGYFIPAANGTFAGTLFYGFSGYVGGWPNGIILTAYSDSTHFLVRNSVTGDTVASGVINEGETYSEAIYNEIYYSVTTDLPVTVSNTPYAAYSGSYYYLVRQIDQSGLGIGTNFYAPVIDGQFDVFSFADENIITITEMGSGNLIWSDTLNRYENYSFIPIRAVYHVSSTKNVSVISSWGGGWGADFVPLNFALSLPDLSISSGDIQFLPEAETRITGELVTIQATVRNLGHETAEQVRVQFYDGDPGAGIAISEAYIVSAIAPGESEKVHFDWTVPEYAAYHNIYVQVDKWDQIRESNESNNTAFKSLIANDDLLPPLTTVVEAPTTVFVNAQNEPEFDTFKVNFDLFNTGTVSAENAKASISLPPELALKGSSIDSVLWENINAGEHVDSSWTVEIKSIPDGEAFFYSVLVEADGIESKVVERMLSIQTPTGLESDNPNKRLPELFTLSPNFPNPFNPETRFQLDLTKTALVNIQVYDVAGRKMADIDKGIKTNGTYTYTFNGSNLVSGIYFLQVELNHQKVAVRKMILVK